MGRKTKTLSVAVYVITCATMASAEVERNLGQTLKVLRADQFHQIVWRVKRQHRVNLATGTPRGAPADITGIEHDDARSGLGQVQCGAQSGEAGADDDNVAIDLSFQYRAGIERRCGVDPERIWKLSSHLLIPICSPEFQNFNFTIQNFFEQRQARSQYQSGS